MKLLYFNPQNDLALADGRPGYVAPAGARAIANAGAALPLWYGNWGDVVMCYDLSEDWFDTIMTSFDLGTDGAPMRYKPGMEACPWGWSAAAKQAFLDYGFPKDALPSDAAIEEIRSLSHRRTAAVIAQKLAAELPDLGIVAAVEYADAEAVCRRLSKEGGVVKAPWSTSGRGVALASDGVAKACNLASGSISKQGSVMYEPEYARALDFAMLFTTDDGKCRFAGTSVFDADEHGRYTGNLVASEEDRFARVAAVCDSDTLLAVRICLRGIIEEVIAPAYSGPLGIDMLITKDGRLVPVVELNLRMTMGHVACAIYDRIMEPGSCASFRVRPLAKGEAAPANDFKAHKGKLLSGTLQLVPPNSDFAFEVQK